MAQLQDRMGRLPEALESYGRALELREELLGPMHFYVATTLDAMANLKDRLGELSEAVAYGQRSLRVWEQVLGARHLHVGRIVFNLASRRDQLGDRKGALDFYRRSYGIFEASGLQQEALDALDSLAELTWRGGDAPVALKLYRRELRLRERLLGAGHSEVLELRTFIEGLEA